GGRKNYMPVLLEAMPGEWFVEKAVSKQRCSYANTSGNLHIHFSVGGDSFPPTALASMLAKYVRELSMTAFNQTWKKILPEILPTAGYPEDAKRFRSQIETQANRMGLDPSDWWRIK
ncbi:MAG: hypothetical protein AAF483_01275, partial [Planctomycetota bacterium]